MIAFPARVEMHFDEKLLCTWADYTQHVLYITMKCGSDGYVDGAERNTAIPTIEAPGEGRGIATIIQRVERRSAGGGSSVEGWMKWNLEMCAKQQCVNVFTN